MLQVDENFVAGDGFMLNLLAVLQKLSLKISLDKVRSLFIFKGGYYDREIFASLLVGAI